MSETTVGNKLANDINRQGHMQTTATWNEYTYNSKTIAHKDTIKRQITGQSEQDAWNCNKDTNSTTESLTTTGRHLIQLMLLATY